MSLRDIALNMLQRNPNLANNPNAQQMIQVIKDGDNAKGEAIANNILQSYGLSKDEGIAKARNFFRI